MDTFLKELRDKVTANNYQISFKELPNIDSLNIYEIKLLCDLLAATKLKNHKINVNILRKIYTRVKKSSGYLKNECYHNERLYNHKEFFIIPQNQNTEQIIISILRSFRILYYNIPNSFIYDTLKHKNKLLDYLSNNSIIDAKIELYSILATKLKRKIKTGIKESYIVREILFYKNVKNNDKILITLFSLLKFSKNRMNIPITIIKDISPTAKSYFLRYYCRFIYKKRKIVEYKVKDKNIYKIYRYKKVFDCNQIKNIMELIEDCINDKSNWSIIANICKNNLQIQKQCFHKNILYRVISMYKSEIDNENADYLTFKLLYSFCTKYEKNRNMLSKLDTLKYTLKTLEDKIAQNQIDKELFYLLKFIYSLTHSTILLKADFDNFPLIENLLTLVGRIQDRKKKRFKIIVLKILSNVLLNFGSFKKRFLYLDGFSKLNDILRDEKLYIHITKLFKNFIHDTPWTTKNYMLNFLPDDFFNFNTELKVLEKQINLIRNMFCCSENGFTYIVKRYNILKDILKMFKFISDEYIKNKTLKNILIHLLYILVNISTHDVKYRRMVCENDIMSRIQILCTLNNNENVDVAIIWLIINLTWDEDDYFSEVVYILEKFQIISWLKENKYEDKIIEDKRKTAVDNIMVYYDTNSFS
ncbi:hypothetical protein SLOPH_2199 [Spraguea lophii 42_110]|uniref:Uncharacterized protein n=1 Tax=Spraguea lophii (strain 42_110) TaxID=1358809 RepID=S7WAZ5_SPRLO|nr:hypothetical protein SLOPH_2199 [Spraguea lophii 42_110]